MFERTIEQIMDEMMSYVPDHMDKRPSSLIYTTLMPVAIEIRQLYIDAEYIMNNAFADTADRAHLIEIARAMSIAPMSATPTIVEARFNIELPIGTRFKAKEHFFWLRTALGLKDDGYHHAELVCETAGALPNDPYLGRIVPTSDTGQAIGIDGLTLAEIIKTLESGEDEEETEVFRRRYFEATRWEHYGGNIADYKLMLEAIPGVGGKKIIPVWDGPGTVKAVITDSTYKTPSDEFLAKVKEIIDPVELEGQGYGKAPIDHKVTIEGAKSVPIRIALNLTYESGASWASVQAEVKAVIEKYLAELRTKWETSENTIVRTAYIDARLLDVVGIKDLQGTKLNGAAQNVILGAYEIPVIGEVSA